MEDLEKAVIVSVNRSWPDVQNGTRTPEKVAREAWVIAEHRTERIKLLIAVYQGRAIGVWGVTGHTSEAVLAEGKTRPVNRVTFKLVDAPPEWVHLRDAEFENTQNPRIVDLTELPPRA